MEFLNLPGVLPALLTLVAAFTGIVLAIGLLIRANAKRIILDMQRELELARGDNRQQMALLKLLSDESKSRTELVAAINKQNEILALQGKQHADAMTMIAESNSASIQLSERIAENVTTFQSFSKEQHAMTRGAIAQAAQEVQDNLDKSITDGLEHTRADIAGVKQDVQDVKRIVERLTPCPDELMVKLDRIELHLMSIEQQVPEKPKLDIEPVEPKPDIAPTPPTGETNGEAA